jgi:Domain of unknown function DUF1828
MGIDVLDRVASAYAQSVHVREAGTSYVVYTPLSFENGRVVTIYVRPVHEDHYTVTDSGQATDELAIAGVDLSTNKAAGRSWDAIRRALDVPPALLDDVGEFELSGAATADSLGQVVMRLSEAAIRVDGLKVFAPGHRRRLFTERVISTAGAHGLAVIPRPKLRTRFGGRREVTCRVEGHHGVYVQALSATSVMEAYDHVRSIFTDSELSPDNKLTAIQGTAKVESWQVAALREVSTVVFEPDLGDFYDTLAA